ncbi:cysteine--tRNA ligase [Candidatus Oleimmundimicrobium sp.]|uniref:cysteine--tRNA ligase n=1 Tax=Candidatus Oleimmundimicrobium sp. TaxID=3060597 RepID=UPI002725EE6D|nr:cysteine--tRNA ligase [Candidatus Oleimmundimicrobium sp.]MDO8885975.1 cysteine--tRNA ligase [Candidatus Oleimmundimicrobium sp.]
MSIKIYNTLSRKKEEFIPREKGKVSMYVCGPTVYNYIHIGNARCYVAFDVVYRYLKYRDYNVTYVRNLTDVDDKIINRANEEGLSTKEIAEKYVKAFHEDMNGLKNEPPQIEPRATEHIKEMIDAIKCLLEKGFAYEVDGDVFFEVQKFKGYGKLSGRAIDEMRAGERVNVDTRKHSPMDFALWKAAKPGEPSWNSPWGEGRPGWHIECSVMSSKYLGASFDIHGGGQDLIFPHHENEIAQAEACTGKEPFVKYWLHNGFVNIKEEKMAKSLGNVILVREILKKYDPNVLRMFFISTHYRSPINYSEENLEAVASALERLKTAVYNINYLAKSSIVGRDEESKVKQFEKTIVDVKGNFFEAMDDDFNTASALGVIFEFVKEMNLFLEESQKNLSVRAKDLLLEARDKLIELISVLGIELGAKKTADEFPDSILKIAEKILNHTFNDKNEALSALIEGRERARKEKDWVTADIIRNELNAQCFELKDTPQGCQVIFKGR